MSKSSRTGKPGKTGKAQVRKKGSAGPIAFFVSLFIIALGTIQLVSTFHTYALNLAELNGLKREEASLIAQKQELENDIKRWDDKAYITAQARERLGFVFPGEQAVRVLHPEAVTGSDSESQKTEDSSSSNKKVLPWYSELSYSLKKADEPVTDSESGKSDISGSSDSSSNDSSKRSDKSDQNTQQNTQQNTGEGNPTVTIDIAAKAKALVDTVLAEPANDHDIDLVQHQLGRYPRGMVAVGARCVCGRPLAVITRPVLPGGIPFPTTCYLTGPEAVKAASHVEAAGVMQQYNDMLASDEELKAAYEQAHNLYLAFRHELAGRLGDSEEHIEGTSAGGMPVRVKCLHALLAQSLVMGPGVNPIGDLVLERVKDEFDPTVCRCTLDD